MAKKFFLLSQVFYPDEVSTAGLFTSLCERLVEEGIEVLVWCAQPAYNHKKRQPRRVLHKGIQIRYLPSTNYNKNSVPGRLCNYFTFTVSVIIKFLFSKDKSNVIVSTNPPYLVLIVAFLCKLKKRQFLYILQDIFPEGLVRLGRIKKAGIINTIWSRLNNYAYIRAKKIIVLGRDMKSWINEAFPVTKNKTLIIPIWQDERIIKPKDFTESLFAKKNKLAETVIIQYSGNMGLWNDMAFFAKAISELNNPRIQFHFIGDGIRKKELLKFWNNTIPQNVAFYSFQPQNQLSDVLAACHISLVSLREEAIGMAVPSKIMGILASGRPTIAVVPRNSEIALIIEEENCGIQVDPGNVEDFIKAVKLLTSNEKQRKFMGQNARHAFESRFSMEIIVKQYINLL